MDKTCLAIVKGHVSKGAGPSINPSPDSRAMKVLYCIFFDAHGMVASICVYKIHTITGQFYVDECLTEVEKHLYSMKPSRGDKGIRLLHDNARPNKAKIVGEKLSALGMVELPHPPYSPDLSPSDFGYLTSLKNSCQKRVFTLECHWDMRFIRS